MNPIEKNQLAKVVKDGEAALMKKNSADKFAAQGLVEINPGYQPDAEGKVQVRLTEAGKAAIAAPATVVEKKSFTVETASALPEVTRAGGGVRGSKYPFDELAAPADGAFSKFRIMDTDVEGGDAFKSISSSVTAANNRFGTVTGEVLNEDGTPKIGRGGKPQKNRDYTRQFKAFRVEGGAEVYRIK